MRRKLIVQAPQESSKVLVGKSSSSRQIWPQRKIKVQVIRSIWNRDWARSGRFIPRIEGSMVKPWVRPTVIDLRLTRFQTSIYPNFKSSISDSIFYLKSRQTVGSEIFLKTKSHLLFSRRYLKPSRSKLELSESTKWADDAAAAFWRNYPLHPLFSPFMHTHAT